MAHEKDILDRKIWRKIEELTTVVEELIKDAKTKVVEESNEKEEGSEKEYEEEGGEEDSEKEGGEEEGKEEGEEPNEGEREEKTEADAKDEDREVPDGEESEKSRGNDGEDRGKAIELEEKEEGLKLVHGTGDWDSPKNICVKLVKLLEEAVAGRYKDINGSDDEYDVVVSLLMGSI
ncbi:spore wall protein 2-like [Malus sylvestris]|uniref:spore wall protein 2-like n=1 Tax=Malus sylvestris TaxID=3752 RepID=UPI0021ACF541|nr:spore wall protein 2-like [Malus sylvestris]XP_050130610.1 spore wall protein 2-like [Malus sylvestris]XP_050130611.1 spore wall protein 2-like [Malus sylvestris]XP_050130612.1 spore wall protein 2-like [Malus sylvestris]XP_050130613.1 spore wall protein 2-like [Malus sylvestris]XP_050130614.1 spore wall protein 2-like [Malus sylvestris]XP_050130615.1 spore wall protein 2-like [Malus sylvestris]XP_050130617.1 spore wall protein 2-like [Malus sylvestris]